MKNNQTFIHGIFIFFLVVLSACGNSPNESKVTSDKQGQNEELTQHQKEDSSTHENDSTMDDKSSGQLESENNEKINTKQSTEEDTSTKTTGLKKDYLYLLNKTKTEVEQMRSNPIDESTFALKEIEGNVFEKWDGLLNEVYNVLKKQLPEGEMEQLRNEQREWIDYRNESAKEASLKYKDGTMEQLEYVKVENDLTEDRCYELVEKYME
ncbi:lysozyme inhibitor LprI family protein [Pseudogracilibacillus sp. SE30717A]|uniref:lysozyme inhibitor LprI family protein n=1 Tax=Pseudogracilibacillus sp. SE30717A TaxID=3098293 RepID=UPI00300E58A3